jgi:DNA repair protein RadC
MKSIGEFMDITLLDHLIITSEAFVSLAQERQL